MLSDRCAGVTQFVSRRAARLSGGLEVADLRALVGVEYAPAAVDQDSGASLVQEVSYACGVAPLRPVARGEEQRVRQQLSYSSSYLRTRGPHYRPGVRVGAARTPPELCAEPCRHLEERWRRDLLEARGGGVRGSHEDEDAPAPTLPARLLEERGHRVGPHVRVDGDAGGAVHAKVRLRVGAGDGPYVAAFHVGYDRQAQLRGVFDQLRVDLHPGRPKELEVRSLRLNGSYVRLDGLQDAPAKP